MTMTMTMTVTVTSEHEAGTAPTVGAVTPRVRALRPYLYAAVVPAVLALLLMGARLGGLLALMWVVLVLTIGVAMTSQRTEQPGTYDPRGRLHG